MRDEGFHKAFIVCGKNILRLGLAAKLQDSLTRENVESVLFSNVEPDPPARIVREGIELCRKSGCDCVIALGGGSSIDTAKAINILRFNDGDILDYASPSVSMNACHGLFAIPTTSGTGSELSNGLIITDEENNRKVPILAVQGMCDYALLDAELASGMSANLTLATGLDVFSHACESYTSILANSCTDLVCEKIMEDVVLHLPRCIADGSDMTGRSRMHACSSMAGWMLACASAHAGHSIAHVLGARLHITHGYACAYGLPAVLRFVAPVVPEKIRTVAAILGTTVTSGDPAVIGEEAAGAYERFVYGTLGLPAPSFSREDVLALAADVCTEPLASLSPRPVGQAEALYLLNMVAAG